MIPPTVFRSSLVSPENSIFAPLFTAYKRKERQKQKSGFYMLGRRQRGGGMNT